MDAKPSKGLAPDSSHLSWLQKRSKQKLPWAMRWKKRVLMGEQTPTHTIETDKRLPGAWSPPCHTSTSIRRSIRGLEGRAH